MKRVIQKLARKLGYEISRIDPVNNSKIEITEDRYEVTFKKVIIDHSKYFVPTYTINEIFSKTEDDFFLALIDVEGAEYEILEGQGAFFKKFNYIAIESTLSTPEYPNFENLKRLNLLLEDFGFDLISSKDKELTSIEEIIIKKNSQLGTKLESNTIDLIYLNNFL